MGTSNPWTTDELYILRAYYPTHGSVWDKWAELLPGRSSSAISNRACLEKLHHIGTDELSDEDFWTKAETRQLLSIVNQTAKLTNHSRLAVARKLTELIRSTHGVMRIKS